MKDSKEKEHRISNLKDMINNIKEDGSKSVRMFMRETNRFVAGSRFKYTPESIELTYDNLVKAISDPKHNHQQQKRLNIF